MNSLRFRPDCEALEARDNPQASPMQVIGAFQFTEAVSGSLRFIGAHLAEGKTTQEREVLGRYATQLTVVSRFNAQVLTDFEKDITTKLATTSPGDPTLGSLLEQTTTLRHQSLTNAFIARAVAIGFGVSPTTIDPPPPPPSPGNGNGTTPPITGLNPNDASGMTDVFPSPTSPNFVDIGTGVKSWDVAIGSGTPVAAGGTVRVFYTLWLADTGQQVETNRNGTPLTSPLSGLIVGWQEGVPGMQPGAIRRLVIPPEKGYGAAGTGTIPPNSTLVFEIKLLTP